MCRWSLVVIGLVACDGGAKSTPTSTTATPSDTEPTTSIVCERGLVDCGGTCVDVFDDPANCGSCGTGCGTGEQCSVRVCEVPLNDCTFPGSYEACDGRCVETDISVDACGSCVTPCSADASCVDGACVPNQGDGLSCATPIVLPDSGDLQVQFWLTGDGTLVTDCGPAAAQPARFFQFIASASTTFTLRVVGDPDRDDLVIEVFSDEVCASSVGCNDSNNGLLPELEVSANVGEPVLFAITAGLGGMPEGRLMLEISD